jgi:hypothetical protein
MPAGGKRHRRRHVPCSKARMIFLGRTIMLLQSDESCTLLVVRSAGSNESRD